MRQSRPSGFVGARSGQPPWATQRNHTPPSLRRGIGPARGGGGCPAWAGSDIVRAGMDRTSGTLLDRVKDAGDGDAWREFFALYFPLLTKYARLRGLNAADAEEVAQNCMETLATHMRGFEYVPARGRFRGYLRRIVNNHITDRLRRRRMHQARTGELEALAGPDGSADAWDQLWLREHLAFCLERLESRCADGTVQAFKLYVLQELPVEEVCARLGLTSNQVYQAKTRMIRRLRAAVGQTVGKVF